MRVCWSCLWPSINASIAEVDRSRPIEAYYRPQEEDDRHKKIR
jgi:hypothetical protein